MKKGYNSTDIQQQDRHDQARRLYRFISDNARRLDDARGCASTVSELFQPSLLAQRSRLREHCEKLIFLDPAVYGRKGEEMLWRKVYYDVVSTAKRLKKQDYTTEEVAHLQCHINAGLGYYHHFISRLELEYDLNLQGIVDFSINIDLKSSKQNNDSSSFENVPEFVELSIHRCLIYLGDLTRYKLEIYPNWDHGLAIRYYLQASNFKPEYGMPHNQLGTLATNLNYSLDSAYHYIRCLDCKYVFEGTENNLLRLFDKNSLSEKNIPNDVTNSLLEPSEHIKRLVVRFLSLVDILYFEKKKMNIHNMCHQVLLDLQTCLLFSKPVDSESGDSPLDSESFDLDSLTTPVYLSSDIIFKMVVVCLMCIIKLKKVDSLQLSIIKAFLLAMYSQLIQNIIDRIQGSVFNISLPSLSGKKMKNGDVINGKKKGIAKLRRRVKDGSEEDSDLSESELSFDNSESDSSEDLDNEDSISSGESDSENKSVPSVDIKENGEVENHKEMKNDATDPIKKVRRMDPNDLLEIVAEEGLLQSIKVLCDWLTGDIGVLKGCGSSSQILLKRIVQLLNLINVETSYKKIKNIKINLEIVKKDFEKIPLPEDIILKGIPILKAVQDKLNWKYLNSYVIEPKEEALFRIHKLVAFGHFLAEISETGVNYDKKKKFFSVAEVETKDDHLNTNNMDMKDHHLQENEPMSRGKLMKHMGQLWLAAEVQNLESRVQQSHTSFSPYLVLDVDALINYTHLAKQLVSARKFIVLIPVTVLSALDELKRETIKARDAIRWLEAQFHRGNRFLRAQRVQERTPVPLIKYPKKKDKDTHTFIQIIECCHFLTQQQKGATNLVTLLTGNQAAVSVIEGREISYVGLAQSAGVNLELITVFHAKWKKSMKGNR